MPWEVEYTDVFGEWWVGLTENQQDDITALAELLMEFGPHLGFPYSSGIQRSRHNHMRELRIQSGGHPFRVFYAFDPRRVAILLSGGDKTGQDRFYDEYILLSDKLYDEHLGELKMEGLIK